MQANVVPWQKEFLQLHQLDKAYLSMAANWFDPLAAGLAACHSGLSRPILVAVNGSQGSGKSTLADYLVAVLENNHQRSAIALSLDDFYVTRRERIQLSQTVHPLLATRGVPGTHDMALLDDTLDALLTGGREATLRIPRFDKAMDDRRPESDWDRLCGPVDIVILEGWCLGVTPQSPEELISPVNSLEEKEDAQGLWRSYVNEAIKTRFLPLYDRVDQWIMLQAPSFDCVFRWRLEQEQKLAGRASGGSRQGLMSEAELATFVQHYQRLTEVCLNHLPDKVHYRYLLDWQRNIFQYRHREGA